MLPVRIGKEHPFCDTGQFLFIFSYLIAWVSDSFWLHYSTFLNYSFHWLLRGSLSLICSCVGVYFVLKAHELIFNELSFNPQVIDWGVYSIVRHPMYFGVLLFLLGLLFWSFSLTATCIWFGFLIFYDRMADFEEEELMRIYGKLYFKYQKKVGKWLPLRRAHIFREEDDAN